MYALKGLIGRFFSGDSRSGAPAFVFVFAAALAGYASLVSSPPAFDPHYSLYMDTANFYWMQALWDKGLFPGDQLAAFYSSKLHSPSPEALWVWITALFIKTSPYTLGLKVLTALSCAAAALMVRSLALASRARQAAGTAAILFAALFLSMDTFFGAPRLYGALVVIGYAWAVEARRFLLLPALAAFCFAAYPAVSVGLAVSSMLVPLFFRSELSEGGLLRRYLWALAGGAAAYLLLLSLSSLASNISMEAANLNAFEAAKFYQTGLSLVDQFNALKAVVNFVLNFNEHGPLYVIFMALLALTYGLGVMALPKRPAMLPRSVSLLLAGCGAAFLVIYPMHPVSASRQLVFVLPLALVFLATEGLYSILGERLRPIAVAAVCGSLFVCLHPFYNAIVSMRRFAGAYEFLAGTPRGSMIAGYPDSRLVDTVPVFAVRPVLLSASTEDQEMLFIRGPKDYAVRRRALMEALYCAAPGAAARLASEYGANWLLVEKTFYSKEFLADAMDSPVPAEREVAAVLEGGADPEACYETYRKRASFSWKNRASEGLIVQLGAGGGK